jgi:hypothetical protein
MDLKQLSELSEDLHRELADPDPEKVRRIGADLIDLSGGGLPAWGAIAWRRAHRFDSTEDQAFGWKVKTVFAKPQFYRDVIWYVDLCQHYSAWLQPDSFEIVPWIEQDAAITRKMVELGRLAEIREPAAEQVKIDAESMEVPPA